MTDTQECIIKTLLENDIPVEMSLVNGEFCYKVSGFYKSGTVTLIPKHEKGGCEFLAVSRYNEEDSIWGLQDLCALNMTCWKDSKDRSNAWASPTGCWVELLKKTGFLKEVTVTMYEAVE